MFGDLEINEITADDIIIDALCLYFGGDAMDKQEPGDPRVIRALENMELLSDILWRRHIKGKGWGELAKALDRRVAAIWGAIDAGGGKSWGGIMRLTATYTRV